MSTEKNGTQESIKKLKCLRCSKEWWPRPKEDGAAVLTCPGCHSPYWNRPRTRPARVKKVIAVVTEPEVTLVEPTPETGNE